MLRKRYARVQKEADELDQADVLEYWLNALCAELDPHTTWFKPASNEDFDIDMSNSVEGIGATLQTEDEYTVVKALVVGGPAEKSGLLHENDKIVAVAQDGQPAMDVVDLRIDKVVKQIRGPKGTEVRLTLEAPETHDRREVTLVRDEIPLEDQQAKARLVDWPASGGVAAAVTAAVVQGVIDPHSCGLGGYLVMTSHRAGQRSPSPIFDAPAIAGSLVKPDQWKDAILRPNPDGWACSRAFPIGYAGPFRFSAAS